jgi:hypothetical protein
MRLTIDRDHPRPNSVSSHLVSHGTCVITNTTDPKDRHHQQRGGADFEHGTLEAVREEDVDIACTMPQRELVGDTPRA